MEIHTLPFRAGLEQYQQQAQRLLAGCHAADAGAIQLFKQCHPLFLDAKIPWLSKDPTDSEVLSAGLALADAQLALSRWYDFRDWTALATFAAAVAAESSGVAEFESAVEAVVNGDLPALEALLRGNPELVRSRSTRVTHFDPPEHRATLLHYVAANGVEGHRQKTPPNAVEVAAALLRGGAEVDSLAHLYGGKCTTMSLLVSSCHPAKAGVQVALLEILLDFGASIEGQGEGQWRSPLMTALAFGYQESAEALVRRGARADHLAAAAGLGRVADARQLLPAADGLSRRRALSLAAQHGRLEVVRLLLDQGQDPDQYNPEGNHAHTTPLHQAVLAGHEAIVRLLVERGASTAIKDTIYQSTPLGWASYCGNKEIESYLQSRG